MAFNKENLTIKSVVNPREIQMENKPKPEPNKEPIVKADQIDASAPEQVEIANPQLVGQVKTDKSAAIALISGIAPIPAEAVSVDQFGKVVVKNEAFAAAARKVLKEKGLALKNNTIL